MRPSNRVITLGLALFAVTGCQRDELAPYAFPQPVTVECESPPSGYLNVNYSWTPEHEFGVDPLMWSAVNLPPGLTMDPATGEISGVPTEVGIFEIEITVRDSNEPAQVSVVSCGSIEILPGGVICGDPFLPNAIVGITPTPSAEEQAADAVVRFWAELDRVSADPNIPLSELTSVAGDQALRQWQVVMTQERGQGHRSVGATQVISPTATHDAATGTYRVVACVDVSKVNVVDQDGKSVVSPNRPPRTKYTYEVSRVEGSYFVVKDSLEGEPC